MDALTLLVVVVGWRLLTPQQFLFGWSFERRTPFDTSAAMYDDDDDDTDTDDTAAFQFQFDVGWVVPSIGYYFGRH